MKTISNPDFRVLIIDLIFKLVSTPFMFLFGVLLVYLFISKKKRESINEMFVNLIIAIRGGGSKNL